jgi:hypothetical protein
VLHFWSAPVWRPVPTSKRKVWGVVAAVVSMTADQSPVSGSWSVATVPTLPAR